QPSGDGLFGHAGYDRVAVERTLLTTIFQSLSDGANDVAARAQFAQLVLRAFRHCPLAGLAFGGEAHGLEMLQAADHQPPQARVIGTWSLGAQVDHAQFVGRAPDLHVQPRPALSSYI